MNQGDITAGRVIKSAISTWNTTDTETAWCFETLRNTPDTLFQISKSTQSCLANNANRTLYFSIKKHFRVIKYKS